MAAKKKGPSMRENQQRKLTMQKIAKGGPQLSGVKKPAPAKPAAPKPPAKPNSRTLANPRNFQPNSSRLGVNLPRAGGAMFRQRTQGPRASAKPTPKPPGGALVRQGNAKPENPRRTNARNRQATAGRGTTGPNRVGQPAGSANRMFGANVVNNSVNRAIAATRLAGLSKAASRLALPVAIANQAKNVVGGFQKLANHPFIKGRPKPAKPMAKPQRQGPAVPARLANAPAAAKLPKPPAATASTRTSAPSRSSSTSAPSRAPSRSSTPARSSAAASRPAATPAKATPKPSLRSDTVQGTGPIKDGGTYARNVKKQPTSGNSFAGSKDMSASEMAASYNTTTNYGSRVNTAFSAESPSTKPSTPKKKSSALTQAEIRKRRLNR